MIAPVLDENNAREITFPQGAWTDLWSGNTINGPVKMKIAVPLNIIPVYLKQGAVVPVGLDSNLTFGRSLTNNKVKAIIITPHTATVEADFSCLVTGFKTDMIPGKNWFALNLKGGPEIRYLILYSADLAEIKVNGMLLPKLMGAKIVSMPPGWFKDDAANRIIVRMPYAIDQNIEFIRRNKTL